VRDDQVVLCHGCHGEDARRGACTECSGSGRATRLRLCDDPWNEVAPGLWQGGHDVRIPSTRACVVTDEFDLVVSLTAREGYGPADGVEHVVVRLADAAVDGPTGARVEEAADLVRTAVAAGRRVLVRCSGGLNRSGLVVAAALIRDGAAPTAAIDAVRRARGPYALTNPAFVTWLKAAPARSTSG